MGFFNDAKDKVQDMGDQNGDGRLSKEDLENLKDGSNNEHIDQLKAKADANEDGKVDASDLGDLKDKLFNK